MIRAGDTMIGETATEIFIAYIKLYTRCFSWNVPNSASLITAD